MRLLRSGKGTHNGRGGDLVILRGMQEVAKEGERDGKDIGAYGEGLGFDEEYTAYAMVVGMSKAEGLEPSTIQDVKIRSDWTKWKEAISTEMKSLDKVHTWDIIK
ncbi:hypothetical protein BDR06DRAFT_973579 [Suillus hirtellus]|nr:hypothetical protein BDR06DRAFT_973579 [Suillus hirtellus]